MMRWAVTLLPVLAFAALAAAFAATSRQPVAVTDDGWQDRPLPAFELPPLYGADRGLNDRDLSGQVVLVNVFASWCGPCRIEHPMLMEIAQSGEVPIFGINWRDNPGAGRLFLKQNGNPYVATGADRQGILRAPLEVFAIPRTLLVDSGGNIRYVHVGPITPEVWSQTIRPLVNKLKAAS